MFDIETRLSFGEYLLDYAKSCLLQFTSRDNTILSKPTSSRTAPEKRNQVRIQLNPNKKNLIQILECGKWI